MRLFSRAAFARLAKVSGAAVTKVQKKWPPDATPHGKVDVDHAGPRAYLTGRGIDEQQIAKAAAAPTGPAKRRPRRERRPTTPRPPERKRPAAKPAPRRADAAPEPPPKLQPLPALPTTDELEELTILLSPILEKHRTAHGVQTWLEIAKITEEITAKRLANEATKGRLISRELVDKSVFGGIDGLAIKLLRDAPKTLARELFALAKSGAPIQEGESKIRRYIEKLIEPVKATAAKVLRDAG